MQEGRQTFVTPDLEPGQTYTYIFKAEMDRDGQKVTRTKRIRVQVGLKTEVDFSDLAVAVAGESAD